MYFFPRLPFLPCLSFVVVVYVWPSMFFVCPIYFSALVSPAPLGLFVSAPLHFSTSLHAFIWLSLDRITTLPLGAFTSLTLPAMTSSVFCSGAAFTSVPLSHWSSSMIRMFTSSLYLFTILPINRLPASPSDQVSLMFLSSPLTLRVHLYVLLA